MKVKFLMHLAGATTFYKGDISEVEDKEAKRLLAEGICEMVEQDEKAVFEKETKGKRPRINVR